MTLSFNIGCRVEASTTITKTYSVCGYSTCIASCDYKTVIRVANHVLPTTDVGPTRDIPSKLLTSLNEYKHNQNPWK
jgi:hypothetical protein